MCDVMAQSFFVVSQQQLVLFISANIWTPPMLIFLSISLFLTCGNGWTTSFDLFFFRLLTCLSGRFVWNHVFKVKVKTVFFDIYLELEMTSSTSIFTTSFVGEFVSRRTNEKFKGWNKETGLGSVIQLVPYMVVAFFLRRRKKNKGRGEKLFSLWQEFKYKEKTLHGAIKVLLSAIGNWFFSSVMDHVFLCLEREILVKVDILMKTWAAASVTFSLS